MNKNIDEEIPAAEFKKTIFEGTTEQKEILSMFCCADASE